MLSSCAIIPIPGYILVRVYALDSLLLYALPLFNSSGSFRRASVEQIASASAARSHSDCPAVLVSITLTAATEGCASEVELFIAAEENPRDVKTYGAMECSAALAGAVSHGWKFVLTGYKVCNR